MSSQDTSQDIDFKLYRYTPSIPAAAVFAAVFIVLVALHGICVFRYKTLFFIPFVIGLLFEAAGYIARIFSHYDTLALGPYIVQTMLILVAPPLFAASIYMTLGRLIVHFDAESASIMPVKYITKVFVLGDVISFLLQCGGGGYMAAGSLSAMEIGENIVIAGLAIQLLFFGFFVYVSAIFHYRVKNKKEDQILSDAQQLPFNQSSFFSSWESLLWCLYGACALILIRSVFRVVEFVQGNDGFIMKREYLLYIFDALLMSLQAVLLLIVYPGKILRGSRNCDSRREFHLRLRSRGDSSDGIFCPVSRKA